MNSAPLDAGEMFRRTEQAGLKLAIIGRTVALAQPVTVFTIP